MGLLDITQEINIILALCDQYQTVEGDVGQHGEDHLDEGPVGQELGPSARAHPQLLGLVSPLRQRSVLFTASQ